MNPNDRSTLWVALMAVLAVFWLGWVLAPSWQPVVVVLVAAWLLVVAWLTTKER